MFITNRMLDLIVKTKDESFGLSLSSAHNEITLLNRLVDRLDGEVKYERARADALVDRLLMRDARVAAVAPAAVAAAAERDKVVTDRFREAFEGLNDVGEAPVASEPRAFDIAGGSAVAR